jgi:hypothetical protein
MSVSLNFYGGTGLTEENLNLGGSGLGFYGDGGFGYSINVGEYQGRTFITDSNGVVKNSEIQNVKYFAPDSGILGQVGSGINLLNIPNNQSTLNIRFTNDTPLQVQDAKLYIYDRININNAPSGVTTKIAEIIHPYPTQDPTGSGSNHWITTNQLNLSNSPGISGFMAVGSGSIVTDTQHDFYVGISCSPNSIGSKLFGMYFSCSYL